MGTITLPSYGTQIDVWHNDKSEDILVLEQSGSPTAVTLIVWEDVATSDQLALIDLYGRYGFPTSPAAGRQTVKIDSRSFVGSPQLTGLKGSERYTVTARITSTGSPNTFADSIATIRGSAAQTFPQLAAALTAALTGVSVKVGNGSNLIFTTDDVGASARVEIQKFGTLFNPASPLLGFNGFAKPLVGVGSTRDVLELNRTDANVLFSNRYNFIVRKRRPYINLAQSAPLGGFRTEYFDSGSLPGPTVGVWRLLGTNELSGSPNTTPSWRL